MQLSLLRYYGSRGLRVARARGQYVWSTGGERYLDAHTGHGVAFLGHNHPVIVERLRRQLEELVTCSPSFECRVQEEALGRLEKIAPRGLDTVAFANSGAEAVETALKMAWAYTGRRVIVAFRGSFHGRTLGALSVTWNPSYRRGFPVLGDVVFLPYNAEPGVVAEEIERLRGRLAAVIVEPVLGEGGVVPAEREFLRAVAEASRSAGALLVLDEVQAGFGRTGRVWAHQHYGVEPDILVAGKALGGGFPVAAVFAPGEVAGALRGGRHGSTYAANPLALAAVSAAVDVLLGEGVAEKAWERGRRLQDLLRRSLEGERLARSVRGLGLMVGVELRVNPQPVLRCLQEERRILALRAGATVARYLPPYMVVEEDLEALSSGLAHCLSGRAGG